MFGRLSALGALVFLFVSGVATAATLQSQHFTAVKTTAPHDVGSGLDDSVTLAIDTSGANARTYTFSVTPRGVRYYGAGRSPVKSYTLAVVGDRFLDDSGAMHAADTVLVGQLLFTNLLGVTLTGGASELRTYATAYRVYSAPVDDPFNQRQIALGYEDSTPSPIDFTYSYAVAAPNLAHEGTGRGGPVAGRLPVDRRHRRLRAAGQQT